MAGVLYLVAIPIGNSEDVTPRALRVLKEADLVVAEERKEGARLMRQLGIARPVETLNEHNEPAATALVLQELSAGRSVALVSDAGTPVFSDPGLLLVQRAIAQDIRIVPVPGASSLLPALIVSGFPLKRFRFAGFLSPKRDRRLAELTQLRRETETIVLMDTPYRLAQLLRDVSEVLGKSRKVCLAFDLTLPSEEIIHGTAGALAERFSRCAKKGEFVLVLGPA